MPPADPIKEIILEHLVWMASIDKTYAWWSAKHQAKLGECLGWSDLPDLLVARMQAKAEQSA